MKKMNFSSIKELLSKEEMKSIQGGSGWCVPNCNCGYGTTCKNIYCDGKWTLMCA